jgi:hypothetical protein
MQPDQIVIRKVQLNCRLQVFDFLLKVFVKRVKRCNTNTWTKACALLRVWIILSVYLSGWRFGSRLSVGRSGRI